MKNNTQLAISFAKSNAIQTIQPWSQVAEIEISYRNQVKPADRPKICTSQDAYQIIYHKYDPGTIALFESFKVLLLNRSNKVLGIVHLSQGGVSGTVVDPKLVFSAALKGAASSIIVSHNHPSGNLNPSEQDVRLTNKLKQGGQLLEIPLLDHIIVTPDENAYYSFGDKGLL